MKKKQKSTNKNQKLTICYLSDIPARIKSARAILEDSNHDITESNEKGFSTDHEQYLFIDCSNPENYEGFIADQTIIDYREPMRSIAIEMTKDSCVPEQFRIIDDRSIGASDSLCVKRKYVIAHAQLGEILIFWGHKSEDNESRSVSGYTYNPDTCEHYTVDEIREKGFNFPVFDSKMSLNEAVRCIQTGNLIIQPEDLGLLGYKAETVYIK